ncbi:hypothetical protein ANCDUO_19420, partial [Ancylostoma duodenale]
SLGNPGSAFFRKDGDPNVLTDPVVKKIAEAHGKTPAQVALRWATQLDVIVIPKSTSEARHAVDVTSNIGFKMASNPIYPSFSYLIIEEY